MPIHAADVYAVEPILSPRSDAPGGELQIQSQEKVIVAEDGARYLTEPVTELMLVR